MKKEIDSVLNLMGGPFRMIPVTLIRVFGPSQAMFIDYVRSVNLAVSDLKLLLRDRPMSKGEREEFFWDYTVFDPYDYFSKEAIKDGTSLSSREQKRIIKRLLKLGAIIVSIKRPSIFYNPKQSSIFYKLDYKRIVEIYRAHKSLFPKLYS